MQLSNFNSSELKITFIVLGKWVEKELSSENYEVTI